MTRRTDDDRRSIAYAVMDLADSFGVYASLFGLERHMRTTRWEAGGLKDRTAASGDWACVTVFTPDGRVGHARTHRFSRRAVELAFHHARRTAAPAPAASSLIEHFRQFEQRTPPLTDRGLPSERRDIPLERAVESHHLRTAKERAGRVGTSLTVSEERHWAVRSDGAWHQTALWRVRVRLEWQPAPVADPITAASGASVLGPDDWEPEALIASLDHELIRTTSERPTQPVPDAGCRMRAGLFLIDSAILARLAHAWLHSPASGSVRFPAVTAVVQQVEGTPGYWPLHPYGYVWAPVTVAARTPTDGRMREAIATLPRQVGGHLWLTLPDLARHRGSTAHPRADLSLDDAHAILAAHGLAADGPLLAAQGIRQLKVDMRSGTFWLLPARLHRLTACGAEPTSPLWWSGALSDVLAGCLGGLGPARLEWGAPEADWTVLAPAFAAVRPIRR